MSLFNCCKLNCGNSLSSTEIEKFLEKFKICVNYESKSAFIIANVSETSALVGKKRKYSRNYHVGIHRVCLKRFCHILGISHGTVQRALQKASSGSLKDLRGGGHNNLPEEKSAEIKKHIDSFPRYLSHYKRETTSAEYLDPELNLALMYQLFKDNWNQKHPETKVPSRSSYDKTFHKMGLKIKTLKTDTCKTCDRFANQIAAAKNVSELEEERKSHWDQAAALRDQMKHDFETGKNEDRVQGICYDLEKVFTLPKAPSNVFYYTRNLNVYNLGIHDGRRDKGFFYVWVENEAGRGAREIASCLTKFLGTHLQDKAEELILWSDSCGGQNRNYIMCLMLHHFLAKQITLKRICLRFLQSGHSYNICDTDFASVETAIRQKQTIFTPPEIIEIMENCRSNNPFDVTKMTVNDFLSSENLMKNVTKREKAEENGQKVSWLKTHEILLSKEHPFKLFMNYDITKEDVR